MRQGYCYICTSHYTLYDDDIHICHPWAALGPVDPKQDIVNKPPHYTSSQIEVIDAIEAWNLNFRCGNVVKYVARAGKKDPSKIIEDLEKAAWYLNREIQKLKGTV